MWLHECWDCVKLYPISSLGKYIPHHLASHLLVYKAIYSVLWRMSFFCLNRDHRRIAKIMINFLHALMYTSSFRTKRSPPSVPRYQGWWLSNECWVQGEITVTQANTDLTDITCQEVLHSRYQSIRIDTCCLFSHQKTYPKLPQTKHGHWKHHGEHTHNSELINWIWSATYSKSSL